VAEHRHLLIVEDHSQFAEILAAMGRLMGFEPRMVPTLREALDALGERAAEVTLLDLLLPDSDTVHTLGAIGSLKAAGAGRIVVITGVPITRDLQEVACRSGAERVIRKGCTEMERALRGAIG